MSNFIRATLYAHNEKNKRNHWPLGCGHGPGTRKVTLNTNQTGDKFCQWNFSQFSWCQFEGNYNLVCLGSWRSSGYNLISVLVIYLKKCTHDQAWLLWHEGHLLWYKGTHIWADGRLPVLGLECKAPNHLVVRYTVGTNRDRALNFDELFEQPNQTKLLFWPFLSNHNKHIHCSCLRIYPPPGLSVS